MRRLSQLATTKSETGRKTPSIERSAMAIRKITR
jgi:hypothetical protein